MKEQVTFPYTTFSEASKDKFKKIGGYEQAFRYMTKGYKAIEWRKRANENVQRELEEERLRFEALQNRHLGTQGSRHVKG